MKKHIREFMRRGFVACGIGPLVLAVLYWILQKTAGVETLTVNQVCLGILSLSVLAFVAGGLNFVYQIERLPLMGAIFIHGAVLYASYLVTYLVNGWLEQGVTPILVFSAIFILGFLAIWAVIYAIMRSRTRRINEMLKRQQAINSDSFEN